MKPYKKIFAAALLAIASGGPFLPTEVAAATPNALAGPSSMLAGVSFVARDTIAPDTLPDMLSSDQSAITPTLSSIPNDSTTAAIVKRLQALMENTIFDRTQVGIYVYDLTADAPIFAHGEHQQLRPASCEKLVTAISALYHLAPTIATPPP